MIVFHNANSSLVDSMISLSLKKGGREMKMREGGG